MGTDQHTNSPRPAAPPSLPDLGMPPAFRLNARWLTATPLLLLLALLISPAQAKEFFVQNTSDQPDADLTDGECSILSGSASPDLCTLRAAIQQANALTGPDKITILVAEVTLTISGRGEDEAATGDLDITDDLEIEGFNATSQAIIRWGVATNDEKDRVFQIIPEFASALTKPVVTFDNVSVQGGYTETALGAGIRIDGGVTTILSSDISNNFAFTSDTPPENPEPDPDSGGITEVATGGGIYVGRDATATIEASTIINNEATTAGGGIDNLGTLTMRSNTLVSFNTSRGTGGGIRNFGGFINIGQALIENNDAPSGGGFYNVTAGINVGNAVVSNATIADNLASQIGGGIYNAGPLTVTNGAVVNNTSTFNAGGIFNGALGSIAMVNSTISGNFASSKGGGIENTRDMSLTNVTVFDNVAGTDEDGNPGGNQIYINDTDGDLITTNPSLLLVNTIIANNDQPSDACGGIVGYDAFVRSEGNNMEGSDTCALTNATDLINQTNLGIDPNLSTELPVGVTGESTPYHALLITSPAVDAGNEDACPAVDQRFLVRDQNCDIGAYEFGAIDIFPDDVVDLKVTLDDTPDPVAPNDEFSPLTYIVAVQNILDSGTAIETSLDVQLPDSVVVTNINSTAGIDCLDVDANNRVTCNLGNISGLQRLEVFISVIPTEEGLITATASVSSAFSIDIFTNNNEDSEETEVIRGGTSGGTTNFGGRQGGGSGALSPWWGLMALAWWWRRRGRSVKRPT